MANIRSIDITFLDDVFDMGGGYVLNFSDRTFAQFFAEELNIDIDDPVYARNGSLKAQARTYQLNHIFEHKVRHEAETGSPFGRARDLFLY